MAEDHIRVGVIGATGYIGTPYRKEMRECPGVEIIALCARRRELLERAADEDGARLVTTDWREVVDHPDVNFVVIATPDALHYDAMLACAAAGKHVLCEKPVGINASEAKTMRDAYTALSPARAHFVPFWTRYLEVFSQARTIYQSGQLGEIKGVVYRWFNPRPAGMALTWRDDPTFSSAGSIADVGSHAYDTVRWILGQEATHVLAHADTITPQKADLGNVNLGEALEWGEANAISAAPDQRKGGTFDYANIAWRYADGAVGTINLSHATYFRKGLAPELELHGTKASLAVDRFRGTLTQVGPDQRPEVIATFPDNTASRNRFEKYVFPSVRAILAGGKIPDYPNLEDGLRVQQFTDASARSAKQGGWVEIP